MDSLGASWSHYLSTESVSKKCDHCHFTCLHSKSYLVHQLSPLLCFHFNRSQHTLFTFPSLQTRLNLHENAAYRLIGIIEHQGRMQSGHYRAYIKPSVNSMSLETTTFKQKNENEDPKVKRKANMHGNKSGKMKFTQSSPFYTKHKAMDRTREEDEDEDEEDVEEEEGEEEEEDEEKGEEEGKGIKRRESKDIHENLKKKKKRRDQGKFKNDLWYCIDDHRMTEIHEQQVLSKRAVLVFYELMSPIAPPPSSSPTLN
ncbi:hypothetical protein HMI55_005596 [Coelomomyces lativittatus]|nr:hypothetical protein HMI56_002878 [Coelomomyces lativittatus]KAJ1517848.1 hypothetical protein HMI55_005596 [Coelomomyces lativittatus]